MNYRHAFHAGNFADLVKHAGLTLILDALTRGEPLSVIDTHAGAGAYDLTGSEAQRSGEAAAGIARLMADPAAPEAFDMLVAAVARENPTGAARVYPGSPALVCAALRADDTLIACELRDDDHARLSALLAPLAPQAQALKADGFTTAATRVPATGPTLILIDPPFERGDDYKRIVSTAAEVLRRNAATCLAIWLPLKDLETFDAFLRGLESIDPPPVLVAEARLRPLADPTRMNGCVLAVINPPGGLESQMQSICDWVCTSGGEPGAEGRVWSL